MNPFGQSNLLLSFAALEQWTGWLYGMFMICINQLINTLVNFSLLYLNIFINLIKCNKSEICETMKMH